ncbi:MAG: InlB B-repeat-containing protein [Spirochaetota bacterium]|nr:InlB B-repeat-containing protein [Spirochaetota bacterium]
MYTNSAIASARFSVMLYAGILCLLCLGVGCESINLWEAAKGNMQSAAVSSGQSASSGESESGESASGESESGESAASGQSASSDESASGESASGESASGESASGESAASGGSASGGEPPEPLTLSGNIAITADGNFTTGNTLIAVYGGDESVSFTYQWRKDGNIIPNETSDRHTPSAPGSYTVIISATGYYSKTSAPVTVTGAVQLTHSVIFVIDGTEIPKDIIHGQYVDYKPADESTRVFRGWYATPEGNTPFVDPVETNGIMLYAKWWARYTVTYMKNDGTEEIHDTDSVIEPQSTVTALPSTNPAREHYIFADWFTMSTGGTKFTANTPVMENISVYAGWTPEQYEVKFYRNETSNDNTELATKSVPYLGMVGTQMPASPNWNGYDFMGWYTSRTGGTEFTASTQVMGTISVYAKWTPVHSVELQNENGEVIERQPVTEGLRAQLPAGYAKETTYTRKAGLYTPAVPDGSKILLTWKLVDGNNLKNWGDIDAHLITENITLRAQYTVQNLVAAVSPKDVNGAVSYITENSGTYVLLLSENATANPLFLSTAGCHLAIESVSGGITIGFSNPSSSDAFFTVGGNGQNNVSVTLQNITLNGYSGSGIPVVKVNSGASFIMKSGSKITGNVNESTSGGAVYVAAGGSFTMSGNAEISGNTSRNDITAAAVYLDGPHGDQIGTGAVFTMSDNSKISGNTNKFTGAARPADVYAHSFVQLVLSDNAQIGALILDSIGSRASSLNNFSGKGTSIHLIASGTQFSLGIDGVIDAWKGKSVFTGNTTADQIRKCTLGDFCVGGNTVSLQPIATDYRISTASGTEMGKLVLNTFAEGDLTWQKLKQAIGDAQSGAILKLPSAAGTTTLIANTPITIVKKITLQATGNIAMNRDGNFLNSFFNVTGETDGGIGDLTLETASGGSMTLNGARVIDNGDLNTKDALISVIDGNLTMKEGVKLINNAYLNNYEDPFFSTQGILLGGAVYVSIGTFDMQDGEISGNSALCGGGVYVGSEATFTMSGGKIAGNATYSNILNESYGYGYGGGVYVANGGSFSKTDGTIYGGSEGSGIGNSSYSPVGSGHAVYVAGSPPKCRDTTADEAINLDSAGTPGNWNQ